MAQLEEKKLSEEIKKKNFRALYYWVVEESIKADQALAALQKAFWGDSDSAQTQIYYGDELDARAFLDAVNTVGFFSTKKFFLVRNADVISAKTWELLRDLWENPAPDTLLIFWGKKLDARLKHAQALTKAGTEVAVVKFEPVRQADYSYWCTQFAKLEGVELEPAAVQALCEWAAADLASLKDALEKAILYAAPAKKISAAQVFAVNAGLKEENVFLFLETFLARQRSLASQQLHSLLEQGQEPLGILALITRQMRILLQILSLRAEGNSDATISQSLRLFPRQAPALFQAAGRWGGQALIAGIQEVAETDRRLKSTRIPPTLQLESLVQRLLQ